MKQSIVFRRALAIASFGITWTLTSTVAIAAVQATTVRVECSGDGAPCPGIVVNNSALKNQPYEARATTEIKQTLADGSHTIQISTSTIARDSDGRTVRIQKLSNGITATTISDPIAKTHTDYTSDAKVAHVMTLPTELPSGATVAIAGGFSGSNAGSPIRAVNTFFAQGHATSSQANSQPNTTTESLGTKTLEGLQVIGTRIINTIPAGTIGNDKDITITRETWHAEELNLDVVNTEDDPRFGHTTYSLTNIQRSEPDATLFQVPSDYKIEKTVMPELPR